MLPVILWGIAAIVGVGLCVAFWDEIKDFLRSAWDWVERNFPRTASAVRTFLKVINRKIHVLLRVFYKRNGEIEIDESNKERLDTSEVPADVIEELKRKGELDISNRDELDGLARW